MARCVPKTLFIEPDIHPQAVMVEWRPGTKDLAEIPVWAHLSTEHQNANSSAQPNSPNISQ